MMKRAISLFLLFFLLCPLAGCFSPVEKSTVRFTDDAGYAVSLTATPVRVAVLFSSYAELWQMAGGKVSITVGESVARGFADENAVLVDVGAGKSINTELLLSEAPDLVIGSLDIAAQVNAAKLLRSAGVPVALFRVEHFKDYLRVLEILTAITGEREVYESAGLAQQREIEALLSSLPKKETSVLFLRAGSTDASTKAKNAEGHFAAAMLRELGTHNIADDAPVLLDGISQEIVLQNDPDAIFISTMGNEEAARAHINALLSSPTFSKLTAVKTGRVYFLPKELFQFKPNGRFAKAYQYLSELLYDQAEPIA